MRLSLGIVHKLRNLLGVPPYRNDYGDFFGRVSFSVTLGGGAPQKCYVVYGRSLRTTIYVQKFVVFCDSLFFSVF